MQNLFFDNRSFRSFLMFSSFMAIGRSMFRIFMMWVIHALFHNPMYTGIAGFLFLSPFVASFIVGPFVDSWNKLTVLRISCFVYLCIAVLLLAANIFFLPNVWLLFLAILLFCLASLFIAPAHTAFLPMIVEGKDLVKANALMNLTGFFGGLIIAILLFSLMDSATGFTIVYAIIASAILIALFFSIFLRNDEPSEQANKTKKNAPRAYFSELKDGLSFVKSGAMLALAVASVTMSFFADLAYVNLPVFAEFHLGTASGYVVLSALSLMGGLLGSYICRMLENFKLGLILAATFLAAGVMRFLFVNNIADNYSRAILIYILYIGLGSAIAIFYRAIVQNMPPKNLISRVDTTLTSITAISAAIGALVGGFLGTLLHIVDFVFLLQAVSYIIIGLCLCLSKKVRKLPKISELKSKD